MTTTPNPGSPEAVSRGCTCPIMDNGHGQGYPSAGGTAFYITGGCPLHAPNHFAGAGNMVAEKEKGNG